MNIYLDGVDYISLNSYKSNNDIKGFTTNPSLLKKESSFTTYKEYAKKFCQIIDKKPVSFEIISDDSSAIIDEAIEISSWSKNIYVKIPIVNSVGLSNIEVIDTLVSKNIPLNVTAVFSQKQIEDVSNILKNSKLINIISIFAGRIADTGLDPVKYIKLGLDVNKDSNSKILWASPREVLNIYQAKECGCDIITVTSDLYKKYISLANKNLDEYSTETSKMFYDDAKSFNLNVFE